MMAEDNREQPSTFDLVLATCAVIVSASLMSALVVVFANWFIGGYF